MRILILTQYFHPEITAPAIRLRALAAGLADRGHEVEVVCEVPNHPQGVVYPGYGRRPVIQQDLDGARVHYVWVYVSPSKRAPARLASYASYAAVATLYGATRQRPDVILASSPPLPVGAVGALLSKRFRVPWVLDVRDLWPEVAVVLGELTNKRMIRAAERLERHLYASAAAITTVTDAFRADIAARTESDAKISVIRNGTTRHWLGMGEAEVSRAELGLPPDRFVWTYAGNVGLAQGLEVAVDAAAKLDGSFQLLVVGGGPMLGDIKARANTLPPGSVDFRGIVEPALAAHYLRASDATLVTLAASPELAKFVPSKLFDCCAVGRPVILAAEGESRRLAADSEAVYPVPPGDSAALASAVRELAADSGLRDRLGRQGREFAAGHLRERQIEQLERILQGAVEQ
jgi:glycosyltransferase involved in cell wall biosynthesis